MSRLYLDASIFTALALQEDGYAGAVAIIAAAPEPSLISDFTWGEFVAAVGRRVRTNDIREKVAHQLVKIARTEGRLLGLVSSDVIEAATIMERFALGLKLPDAIHIVIARRLNATLISADRQQIAAAQLLGSPCINPNALASEEHP